MRAAIVLASMAQPCAPLIVSMSPGSTTAPTCAVPSFVEVAASARGSAACGPGDVAWAGGTAYTDLQDAIDATPDGDAVLVCPGQHIVNVAVRGRTLELSSVSGSAADTILDGAGSRLIDADGSDLTVSDLTLQGGQARNGGALKVEGGSVLLSGVTMTGHSASYEGGAVHFDGRVLAARDSDFSDNFADYGGGAILVSEASCASLTGSTFTGNRADYEGGAISAGSRQPLLLEVVDSTFLRNFADYEGGAIAAGGWDVVTTVLEGSTFEQNTAGYGGGAVASGGQGQTLLFIEDSTFLRNKADYQGGGVAQGGWEPDELVLRGATFEENESRHGGGLAIGGWGDQIADIEDLELLGNVGGGALLQGSHGATVATTIERAIVSGNSGHGIFHREGFLQGIDIDFGPDANTPHDLSSDCGPYDLGLAADFTCDGGSWSVP